MIILPEVFSGALAKITKYPSATPDREEKQQITY